MNSIGLENPGIAHFCANELQTMLEIGPTAIANLSGSTIDDYVEGARLLDLTNVEMIELNISCPNMRPGAGGMAFGMKPDVAADVVDKVKRATKKPIMVKLTPNAPELTMVAKAVIYAGADAISLVNTFQALAIDIDTGKPIFNNTCAGLSGPGIKPIALRMVYDVCKMIRSLPDEKLRKTPVVGLGGISTWQDAVEFIMAGCTAIQVGTATFSNPNAMVEIVDGLYDYMSEKGFATINDFRGMVFW